MNPSPLDQKDCFAFFPPQNLPPPQKSFLRIIQLIKEQNFDQAMELACKVPLQDGHELCRISHAFVDQDQIDRATDIARRIMPADFKGVAFNTIVSCLITKKEFDRALEIIKIMPVQPQRQALQRVAQALREATEHEKAAKIEDSLPGRFARVTGGRWKGIPS